MQGAPRLAWSGYKRVIRTMGRGAWLRGAKGLLSLLLRFIKSKTVPSGLKGTLRLPSMFRPTTQTPALSGPPVSSPFPIGHPKSSCLTLKPGEQRPPHHANRLLHSCNPAPLPGRCQQGSRATLVRFTGWPQGPHSIPA